jgi:hypothetical protein
VSAKTEKKGKTGRRGWRARNSEVEIGDQASFEGVVRSSGEMRAVEVDDRTARRRDEVDDVGRRRTRKSSESRVGKGSLRRENKKTMSANRTTRRSEPVLLGHDWGAPKDRASSR